MFINKPKGDVPHTVLKDNLCTGGSGRVQKKSSAGRDPGPGHHNPEHATSKGVVRAQDVTCGEGATRMA